MPRKMYSIDCTWLIGHGNDVNNLVTVDEVADNALPKRYVICKECYICKVYCTVNFR